MKVFFIVTAAVFSMSSAAFAMPKVGDQAIFDITVAQGSQVMKAVLEYNLTGFDAQTNMFTRQTKITTDNEVQDQVEQVAAGDLATDEQISQVMAYCALAGGKLEKIKVAAGEFNTCAYPVDQNDEKGTIWIGNVAFGLVKQDTVNGKTGQHTVGELKSFAFGK